MDINLGPALICLHMWSGPWLFLFVSGHVSGHSVLNPSVYVVFWDQACKQILLQDARTRGIIFAKSDLDHEHGHGSSGCDRFSPKWSLLRDRSIQVRVVLRSRVRAPTPSRFSPGQVSPNQMLNPGLSSLGSVKGRNNNSNST